MSLVLQRFASGDTTYVAKHNGNAEAIEREVNSLRSALSSSLGGAVSLGAAFEALFGSAAAVIGASSYRCTGSGSTLTVAGGFAWIPGASLVVSRAAASTLSFAGLAAGTYYVSADATGAPVRSSVATEALYQVVWSGSAFTSLTRTAVVLWGAADQVAAQSSSALGANYETLDARLEAGESAASAGATPYVPAIANLACSASIMASFATADVVRVTLAGNPLITLAGAADGQKCVLELTQDATGNRVPTWSGNLRTGADLPVLTLSTAGGALDRLGFIYHAAAGKYDLVALARGF